MWILSQDKRKLFDCKRIYISNDFENIILEGIENNGNFILGEYESHKKALEVLREMATLNKNNNIYFMPEK